MSIHVDVVNSAMLHLLPKYVETFLQGHPFLEKLWDGGKVKKENLKGPYMEFDVVVQGPGKVTAQTYGTESLASTRKTISAKGNEFTNRSIYHFDIPNKDLALAGGENDLAEILENYPEVALADFRQQFSAQVIRAASSSGAIAAGLGGYTTLNGQQTYAPNGTARTGVFTFSTTQNATVHGLPMEDAASSPTTGWKHGYADISSMGSNGLKQLRTLKQAASQSGLKLEGGGVDLMLADQASYQNVVDEYDAAVIVNDKIDNPASKFSGRDAIKFDGADLYWEPDIDLTDTTSFSGVALDGLIYGLSTAFWCWLISSNNQDKTTNGMFELTPPMLSPFQDAWQWRIINHSNIFCKSLRHQFALTGSANA